MKTETFHLELITPSFCGGAEPERQAEIRSPSIRGQLRWWFRTLGGFKSLDANGMSVRDQETLVFGSTAGDDGKAGKLVVRVTSPQPKSETANADDLGAGMNTPMGYALFPLRPFGESDGRRAKVSEEAQFHVSLLWRGEPRLWDSLRALAAVWGHLGCLGFRGRRALGALRLVAPGIPLAGALQHFAAPSGVLVCKLTTSDPANWRTAAADLLTWYRSWRQHGQMNQTWVWNDRGDRSKGGRWNPIPAIQQAQNRVQPGFKYARRDHNEGLDVQGTGAPNPDSERPRGNQGESYRPALGLPIIQFFSSLGNSRGPIPRGRATVNWDWEWNVQKEKGEGRFASPVLLRPHKDAAGRWHALVIFVDSHRWPDGKPVYLNGQEREIAMVTLPDGSRSPALYEAMKSDKALKPFNG